MATSVNPFRTKVDLLAEKMAIKVTVIKKEDDSVLEEREYAATDVAESLRSNIVLYGLSKLLQDRTSETEVGPGKIAAMDVLFEQFKKGVWTQERKVGSPVVSAEVEALAQVKGLTVAEAQAALKKYDAEARKNILANPKIVELANQIREGRKNAEGIDLTDLSTPVA